MPNGGVAGGANDPKRKLFGIGKHPGEPKSSISKADAVKAAKAAKPKPRSKRAY